MTFPRWALIGVAAASTFAWGFAIYSGALVAALFALSTPALLLVSAASQLRQRPSADVALLEQAVGRADVGRKLVIYERETGLFAHWYIALRCDEECQRATRYQHNFTLITVEPSPESDAWTVQEAIATWLREHLRTTDLAAYVGNAGYVVLMPETPTAGAEVVAGRLRSGVEGAQVGVASSPEDAGDFEQLLAAARNRLAEPVEVAA